MKINYHGTDTPSPEAIVKVREALFLLDGMNGFRTPNRRPSLLHGTQR